MNTGTKVTTGDTATTHDIELPKPFMTVYDDVDKVEVGCYSEIQVRAAIEADRKLHDRMLAHEWIRPSLGLVEDAPYRFDFYAQEIEELKAELKKFGRNENVQRNDNDHRKRRGEPSKCPECSDPDLSPEKHWQDGYDDGVAAALRRGEPVKMPSDADIDAVWRELTGRSCIPGSTAHAFARALLARYRNSDIGQPTQPTASDEPVKVDAEAPVSSDDALDDALSNLEHDNYEQSYSGYKNRQADIALIRAALTC